MVGITGAVAAMTTTTYFPVSISPQWIASYNSGASTTASYSIFSDGTIRDHNLLVLETWLPTGTASNFEARVTVTGGSLSSGATGSWVGLGSNRTWSLTIGAFTTQTCDFTVEIRDAATQAVQDSASINLLADSL